MVLVLPLLVFMFVLTLWVAKLFIAQSQLTASVRNQAWRQRTTTAQSQEFEFQNVQGEVRAQRNVDVPTAEMFGNLPDARSSHVVFGDSWSARLNDSSPAGQRRFREINDHWNSELQLQLLKSAGVNTAGELGNIGNLLSGLGDQLGSLIAKAVADALAGDLGSLVNQFSDLSRQKDKEARQELEQQKQQARDEIARLDGEIAEIDRQLAAKRMEADAARKRIAEIDDKLARAEDPQKEEDKLTDEQKQQLRDEKKMQEQTRDRIEKQEIPPLERQREQKVRERQVQEELLKKSNV